MIAHSTPQLNKEISELETLVEAKVRCPYPSFLHINILIGCGLWFRYTEK